MSSTERVKELFEEWFDNRIPPSANITPERRTALRGIYWILFVAGRSLEKKRNGVNVDGQSPRGEG